jgi:hypothetical protein
MFKYILPVITLFFVACGDSDNEGGKHNTQENFAQNNSQFGRKRALVIIKDGITLTEQTDYPVFKDAEITMISPKDKATPGKTNFEFSVNNFTLGEKTSEQEKLGFKGEENGQFITFISSGHLPKHSVESTIEEMVNPGENYVFATLTRSYNMSVHDAAKGFVFSKITIEDNNKSKITKPTGSHIVPLSPMGEYPFEFSKKILLDFFLIDTKLSDGGNYVLITIDNTEFKITKWASFAIEGLSFGSHSISFKLMDAKNQVIPGPFNDLGKIEFSLKEKEITL